MNEIKGHFLSYNNAWKLTQAGNDLLKSIEKSKVDNY